MPTAAGVGFLLALGAWPRGALGFPSYAGLIPNGDAVVRNGLPWSGVGHADAGGGPSPTNPFGAGFAGAGYEWTEAFCRSDSDGDGQSNGLELGDPDCVWTEGETPARASDISHPGFADSTTQVAETQLATTTTATAGLTLTATIDDTTDTETRTTTASASASHTTTFGPASSTTSVLVAQVEGSLILNVSNSSILAGDGPASGVETALAVALAEMAGVDAGAVAVVLTASRRLQPDAAITGPSTLTVAYTIEVEAGEAAGVAARLRSTDLASAGGLVTRHLNDAGFGGTVDVVGLSADLAGDEDGSGSGGGEDSTRTASLFALATGGFLGAAGALLVVLCCLGSYRCWGGAGGGAAERGEALGAAPPDGCRTEDGAGAKYADV